MTDHPAAFDLIETMRFDAWDGLLALERHMARLKASAKALGFPFDHHGARNELQAATFRLRDARLVRLRLSPRGSVAIQTRALPSAPPLATVALAPLPLDPRLHHNSSDRRLRTTPRDSAGADEILFVDDQGWLTQGGFTSVFVERDGRLLTPPAGRLPHPGVLRAELIEAGRAIEQDLVPADLAGGFFIGNQISGLVPARLVAAAERPGL